MLRGSTLHVQNTGMFVHLLNSRNCRIFNSLILVQVYTDLSFSTPIMPKSKKFVESSDDSSDSEPKSEKKVSNNSKRKTSDAEATQSKKPKKENKKEEDNVWDLGNNRQVTVREFKGKILIDIREMYYDKEGELRPGKKGISLNTTQWRKFVDVVADVDEAVKSGC
ncbi:activated RNA polymerase II transcriptional coactivator p15 [Diprion similis]|uniref:activated RNA polymerase II transcriptional coactivator p15 n=1 Tax=Diprion similis TaxID=362088 RepID=UPI001EF900E4|nr:activated RNA polymerase II transcriptional coactivator p15 [Diprion similis]